MHACHGHRYPVPQSATGKKGSGGSKGGGGTACTGGYKEVGAVRPESVAGGGYTYRQADGIYVVVSALDLTGQVWPIGRCWNKNVNISSTLSHCEYQQNKTDHHRISTYMIFCPRNMSKAKYFN